MSCPERGKGLRVVNELHGGEPRVQERAVKWVRFFTESLSREANWDFSMEFLSEEATLDYSMDFLSKEATLDASAESMSKESTLNSSAESMSKEASVEEFKVPSLTETPWRDSKYLL